MNVLQNRIAELEAERDRLTALTEAQTIALRSVAEDKTAARIAELEAEVERLKEHQFADHIIALEDEVTLLNLELGRMSVAFSEAVSDAREWKQKARELEAQHDALRRL